MARAIAPAALTEHIPCGSRVTLCDTTARVLAKGLDLLGIGVPERM